MPLNQNPLELEPEPQSVQIARKWIAERFVALGREDLIECAQLGTSELVTNALLHADHPMAIRLRGTRANPRVEVSDGSRRPPLLPGPPGGDMDDLLATFGRGLDLVAKCSVAWGATIERDGKVVWFEPAPEPHEEIAPSGNIWHEEPDDDSVHEGETVPLTLLNMPVSTMLGLRRHNSDLRRELRLLSFTHSERYPLATTITDIFTRFDARLPPDLRPAIDDAAAQGQSRIDIRTQVAVAAAPLFRQMRELLMMADQFCRAQRLLSLERSPHQRDFQNWILGELETQALGGPAHAWPPSATGRSESAS